MRHHLWPLVVIATAPLAAAWLTASEPEAPPSVLGLWSQYQPVEEGDPVRFYYFHSGGIGLFRYGRMGLTYTKSFRYDVDKETLRITFVKSGAAHAVAYRLEDGALMLDADPVMGGKQTYRRQASGSGHSAKGAHPFARLWTDKTSDRAGQEGFRMYQLQAPALDGRGVGWYHEGDFAEWSTESLTYRRSGDALVLTFTLRDEVSTTPMVLGEADGARFMALERDPRNFWHPRRYADGGPGFTVQLDGEPLPYRVPGHAQPAGCPHAH